MVMILSIFLTFSSITVVSANDLHIPELTRLIQDAESTNNWLNIAHHIKTLRAREIPSIVDTLSLETRNRIAEQLMAHLLYKRECALITRNSNTLFTQYDWWSNADDSDDDDISFDLLSQLIFHVPVDVIINPSLENANSDRVPPSDGLRRRTQNSENQSSSVNNTGDTNNPSEEDHDANRCCLTKAVRTVFTFVGSTLYPQVINNCFFYAKLHSPFFFYASNRKAVPALINKCHDEIIASLCKTNESPDEILTLKLQKVQQQLITEANSATPEKLHTLNNTTAIMSRFQDGLPGKCPICLEFFNDHITHGLAGAEYKLACKHSLCTDCFGKWQTTCPTCRREI